MVQGMKRYVLSLVSSSFDLPVYIVTDSLYSDIDVTSLREESEELSTNSFDITLAHVCPC